MVKMSIGTGIDSTVRRGAGTAPMPADTPPVMLTAPTLSGSGRIGAPLTAAPGTWGGAPAPSLALRWQRGGANIPGATGTVYVPVTADDLADLHCVVTATNRAGTASAATATQRVTYAPPVATGVLADQIYDLASGPRTVAAAGAFSGAGLTFAVTGAGATINAASGVVTLSTDTARSGAVVTVTASNSGGAASRAFQVTVAEPPSFETLPELSPRSSLSTGAGITITQGEGIGTLTRALTINGLTAPIPANDIITTPGAIIYTETLTGGPGQSVSASATAWLIDPATATIAITSASVVAGQFSIAWTASNLPLAAISNIAVQWETAPSVWTNIATPGNFGAINPRVVAVPVAATGTVNLRVRAGLADRSTAAISATAPVTVSVTAPALVAPIPDQSLVQGAGGGTSQLAVASSFSGAPITWSVAGGGAAVSASGVVTLPTTAVQTGTIITVTATNAGGSASDSFTLVVTASGTQPTTPATTAVAGVVRATLAAARPVGTYANGDPFIVSTQAGSITGLTPAGSAPGVAAGAVRNGAMQNPGADQIGETPSWLCGFDGRQLKASGVTNIYTEALNVDPARKAAPIAWTAGQEFSIVKAASVADAAYTDSARRTLPCTQSYHVITVCAEAPPVNAFRPPVRSASKTVRPNWTLTEMRANMGIFRSTLDLTNPTDWPEHTDQARSARLGKLKALQASWAHTWDSLDASGSRAAIGGYGRTYAGEIKRAMLDLHSTDLSAAEKEEIAVAITQIGLDLYGAVVQGARWQDNGGWTQGRIWPVLIAGLLLNDTYILNSVLNPVSGALSATVPAAGEAIFAENKIYNYVLATAPASGKGIWVGSGGTLTPPTPANANYDARPNGVAIPPEMVGFPEWGINAWKDPASNSAHPVSQYRWNNLSNALEPALAVDLLNTTVDLTLLDAIREAMDRFVRIAKACWDGEFSDAYDGSQVYWSGGNSPTASTIKNGINGMPRAAVDLYMATARPAPQARSLWTGRPEMAFPPALAVSGTTITVTPNAYEQGNGKPITQRDVRYSQDGGTSWTTINGITLTGGSYAFAAPLASTQTLVQLRLRNGATADDIGAWSTNQPNLRTPTSTTPPAAAYAVRGRITTGVSSYAPAPTTLTIAEALLPVYDSDPFNATAGDRVAKVPVAGTHNSTGSRLQLRILNHATNAVVVDWQNFTAGSGGVWSVTARVPRGMTKVKAQVRAQDNTARIATQSNGWFSGYVIAFMGQSDMARSLEEDQDLFPTLAPAGEKVWLLQNATNATPNQGGVVRLSEINAANLPFAPRRIAALAAKYFNAPLMLCDMTMSGTGRNQFFDDADGERNWFTTGADLVAWLRASGTEICYVHESWWINDINSRTVFARQFAPGYLGLKIGGLTAIDDGTGAQPCAIGDTVAVGGNTYSVDHILWDLAATSGRGRGLFDKNRTKWGMTEGAGYYNQDGATDGAENSNTAATNTYSATDRQRADFARNIRAAIEADAVWQPITLRSVAGRTGQASFGGYLSHFNGGHCQEGDPDGEGLNGLSFAQAAGRAVGALPANEPDITGIAWASNGAYADVTISLPGGGNLTTAAAEYAAGRYAGLFEAKSFDGTLTGVTGSPPVSTGQPIVAGTVNDAIGHHQVHGFSILRAGAEPRTRQIQNFTAVVQNAGTGTAPNRTGVVRITPTTPFANGDQIAYSYGDHYTVSSKASGRLFRPAQRKPIESYTGTMVSGAGYGFPVRAHVSKRWLTDAAGVAFTASGISGGGATAPAQIGTGDWTASAGNALVTINLTALPAGNGAALDLLQYSIDAGATWITLPSAPGGALAAGARDITGLSNGTTYSFTLRARNAAGSGTASAAKTATPAAAGASSFRLAADTAIRATANLAAALDSLAAEIEFRIDTMPALGNRVLLGVSGTDLRVQITPTGQISYQNLENGTTSLLAPALSAAGVITTATWITVGLSFLTSTAGSRYAKIWVNGSLVVDKADADFLATGAVGSGRYMALFGQPGGAVATPAITDGMGALGTDVRRVRLWQNAHNASGDFSGLGVPTLELDALSEFNAPPAGFARLGGSLT